jgi:hypothetical protein
VVLRTAAAVQQHSQVSFPALRRDDPGASLPGRIVAHVLGMAALQVGHPMPLLILMEVNNAALLTHGMLSRLQVDAALGWGHSSDECTQHKASRARKQDPEQRPQAHFRSEYQRA